jgi:hypothetical protein
MTKPPMKLAGGPTGTRAWHGRARAKMGEYGGHFEAPVPK